MRKDYKMVDGHVVCVKTGLTYMKQEVYSTKEQAMAAMGENITPVSKKQPFNEIEIKREKYNKENNQ